MCGIVGFAGSGPPGHIQRGIREAAGAQRHRGPDDAGMLVMAPQYDTRYLEKDERQTAIAACEPDIAFTVLLAHQRLAILDPGPTGAQPMASRDGGVWLAYNGEIYNHVELRAELGGLGHEFAGRSDTEVLLAAYCEWGLDCLARLAGMFAFALVDRRRRWLVLARDHVGQKPMFTRQIAGGLAFASEVAPLLRIGTSPVCAALGPTLDYLATGRTDHRAETMIEGVRRVDPGTAVIVTGHPDIRTAVHRYWSAPAVSAGECAPTFVQATEHMRELFLRSVGWHLRSDVPVGSLLSGGLDSSAIVLAQRRVGGPTLDLSTVSYIGGHGAVSEEPWIDMVTATARCHTKKLYVDADVWDGADTAAVHQGEPIGGPAILVHRALCRRAQELGIKVLLDGQGADELLGGYPAARSLRVASLLRQGRIGTAMRLLAASSGGSRSPMASMGRMGLRALRLAAGPSSPTGRWPWIRLDRETVLESLVDPAPARTLHQAVRRYLTGTLPAILRWEDRNTMEVSLEGRLPFLLPEFVDYCLHLPEEHLIGPAGQTKHVLREAVNDLVPAAVRDRREKVGLSVPLRSWLREIPEVGRRLEAIQDVSLVSQDWVRSRRSTLGTGRRLSGGDIFVLWRLVGFDLWREALGVSLRW